MQKPPPTSVSTRSYVFRFELIEEDDGRWSVGVAALPGCATWGHTREEALSNLQDAVEIYLLDMREHGEEIPHDDSAHKPNALVVAVTL